MPSCSSARGRLASITTSARRISARSVSTPSARRKSSATERLRPFRRSKKAAGPAPRPVRPMGRLHLDHRLLRIRPAGRRTAVPPTAPTGRRRSSRLVLAPARDRAGVGHGGLTRCFPDAAPPGAPTARPARPARRGRGSRRRRRQRTRRRGRSPACGRVRARRARRRSLHRVPATPPDSRPPRRRSRQLPPQLVVPRRHRPMCTARSPSKASASRSPKGRANSSTPSTSPAGGPSGVLGRPGERHRTAGRPASYPGVVHPRQGNVSRFSNT